MLARLARRPSSAVILVAALALGACKVETRQDDAPQPTPDTKSAKTRQEAPTKPRGTSGTELLFAASKPALPASIAELRAGQQRAKVHELAPGLKMTERPKYATLEDPNLGGVTWTLRFDDLGPEARLLAVWTELDKQRALALAKRSWGEPRTVTDGAGKTTFYWFDEDAKLRASLAARNDPDKLRLEFWPYVSATEFVGAKLLDLPSGALLGLTRAQIEAEHGDRLRRVVEGDADKGWSAHLWYPATTWSPQPSLVRLDADPDGDVVTRVRAEVPFLFLAKLRAQEYAKLVEVFGAPVRGDGEAEGGARFETANVVVDATVERGRWLLATTKK